MKHDAFDESLRRRAQEELFEISAEADARVARAIRRGMRVDRKPQRATWAAPLTAAVAACAIAALVWLTQPITDRTVSIEADFSSQVFETVLPLTNGTEEEDEKNSDIATDASAAVERGVWRAEARFSNDTQDIYLVSWSVDGAADLLEPPDELIWLEPGASCTDYAAWPVEGEQETPVWRYTAYRVTADMLHWMDGDWLRPGEEGYAAQQALITDAYENGALVLAPGDWENGMAGPMALVLPDAMGNTSPLETYLAAGLVVEESGKTGHMRVETGATPAPTAVQRSLPTPTATAYMPEAAHP